MDPFLRKMSTNITKRSEITKQIDIITTPWCLKSSESNISSYYEASIVSHSSRKHALVQQSERYRKFLGHSLLSNVMCISSFHLSDPREIVPRISDKL